MPSPFLPSSSHLFHCIPLVFTPIRSPPFGRLSCLLSGSIEGGESVLSSLCWSVSLLPPQVKGSQLALAPLPARGVEPIEHTTTNLLLIQQSGPLLEHTSSSLTHKGVDEGRMGELRARLERESSHGRGGVVGSRDESTEGGKRRYEVELEAKGQAGGGSQSGSRAVVTRPSISEEQCLQMALPVIQSLLVRQWANMMSKCALGWEPKTGEARAESGREERRLQAKTPGLDETRGSDGGDPSLTCEERLRWEPTVQPVPYFKLLHALGGKRVVSMAAGRSHALAMCEGVVAEVLSWGQVRVVARTSRGVPPPLPSVPLPLLLPLPHSPSRLTCPPTSRAHDLLFHIFSARHRARRASSATGAAPRSLTRARWSSSNPKGRAPSHAVCCTR